jgi:hypothetical protein
LICPVESQELELPKVGEVVEFQGMDWKVVGVDEFDSDRCDDGIQIVLQLCPCEEELLQQLPLILNLHLCPQKRKRLHFHQL